MRTTETPDLNASIQRSRREGIGVLGVEFHHHDVMGMSLKVLRAVKSMIPVPALDGHVVTAREEVG